MKIGSVEIKNGIMLAPMAGFSDRAMRVISHKLGAEYSVTEMVSAKATCYRDKKTARLAKILSDEGPCAVQIFGSEPDVMARAAEILSRPVEDGVSPCAIDINMGCPVNKIFSNGEGSSLMKNPDLIYRIVRAVSCATPLPTTVKMRLGIDREHINATECAIAAQEGGAALIALHGRTRVEMYSGTADMKEVRRVKESLHIPLIANGDIASGEDALRVLAETGADGVMIGRGAIGNPFIFDEIAKAISGVAYLPPSVDERIKTALCQLSIAVEEKGEEIAVRECRKQIALYLRSFRGSAQIRARINRALTFAEVSEIMHSAKNL